MNFHSPAVQADLHAYNASMEKSLEDKLFFLDHTAGAMTFVDFGCANGAVLKAISEKRQAKTLIGIDINPLQLAIASQKVPNGVFVESFELVRERIEAAPGPKVAIFSSVLHEEPRLFTEEVANRFDYIVIRDMGITGGFARARVPVAMANKVIVGATTKVQRAWTAATASMGKTPYAQNMGAFTEFLLKYPYLGNTEAQTQRELAENYPMPSLEDLIDNADPTWATIIFEHYSAPWVVDRIRQDFGFEFPFPTHFKMILKKVTA